MFNVNKKPVNRNVNEFFLDFGKEFAKEAGSIIRADFNKKEFTLKEDNTPVTKTDVKINEMLIEKVSSTFNTHQVLGEERSVLKSNATYTWVCDPLDGTISFLHGSPTCSFSLALLKNEVPIIGITTDPFMDRLYVASLGNGATLNGKKISTSNKNKLKNAVIGMSYWPGAQIELFNAHKNLVKAGASVLMLGSIVYSGNLVASGDFDAAIHPARFTYDSAALSVIIPQAGGKVTSLTGKEQRYVDNEIFGAVMSNGLINKELFEVLSKSIR